MWGITLLIHSQSWWRHQMETFSALLAICAGNSPVPGEFPAQRTVTRSFDVFFELHPNKRLSKQRWGWWFETPLCPLWHHCDDEDVSLRQINDWGSKITYLYISIFMYNYFTLTLGLPVTRGGDGGRGEGSGGMMDFDIDISSCRYRISNYKDDDRIIAIMGIPLKGKTFFILGRGTGRVKNFRQNNYDNVFTRKWHKHTCTIARWTRLFTHRDLHFIYNTQHFISRSCIDKGVMY